jgi:hypothetical protein
MPLFKITLRGSGLWIDIDGDAQRVGFHVTRVVEAEDVEGASQKAVTLIRTDRKAQPLPGKAPPQIWVEEAAPADSAPAVAAGFKFFPDPEGRLTH